MEEKKEKKKKKKGDNGEMCVMVASLTNPEVEITLA